MALNLLITYQIQFWLGAHNTSKT